MSKVNASNPATGYFSPRCRHCGDLVYEGDWITPRERHEVQQHHRELCSARLPDAGEDASRRGEQSAVVLTIVRAPQPLPRAATG